MNLVGPSIGELGVFLLAWAVLIGLVIWFIRTLSSMASALREIADRLGALERAVREESNRRTT